ncbi:MAG TPA: bacterial transcriptional activator domain-containing protein [Ilumatobacteraceae bacterium]|nr:bacterial transcriptional activator domain-containing protein [Ilumatobacteraceae bacterium]
MARLYLTGGLRLDGPAGHFTDSDLPGRQGRLAFAALAVERRPLSHDHLADIIWDESPPPQWKTAIAPVISKIRTLITLTGLDGSKLLTSGGGAYCLSLPSDIWVDLESALRALDRAEGALRHGDDDEAARDATVASGILRRPFLTGVDNLWADGVRHRIGDALYRCSITLATAWNNLGDHQLAATVAQTAIDLDPLREVAHRILMRAEQARGDHSSALRAYLRCVDILATEVDAKPSPETVELAETIRAATAPPREA